MSIGIGGLFVIVVYVVFFVGVALGYKAVTGKNLWERGNDV